MNEEYDSWYEEDEYDDYENYDDDDQSTWGQKRDLCDQFDNCYSCPYASQCF